MYRFWNMSIIPKEQIQFKIIKGNRGYGRTFWLYTNLSIALEHEGEYIRRGFTNQLPPELESHFNNILVSAMLHQERYRNRDTI